MLLGWGVVGFSDLWPQAQSFMGCESFLLLSLSPRSRLWTWDCGGGLSAVVTAHWSLASKASFFTSSLPAGLPSPCLQPPLCLQPGTNPASTLCCQSKQCFFSLGCQQEMYWALRGFLRLKDWHCVCGGE